MPDGARYLHGTVVVVGERGVLIRGASGSGKSRLAALLMAEAQRRGWFAALVGDDRVELTAWGDRIIARGHPSIAGRLERRGEGITDVQSEPACVIDWVIDLTNDAVERLPPAEPVCANVLGLRIRCILEAAGLGQPDCARLLDRVTARRSDPDPD